MKDINRRLMDYPMRNLLIFMTFMAILAPASAKAEGEMRRLGHWFGVHPDRGVWADTTKFNPYLENGLAPHPEAQADNGWTPSVWIQQKRNGLDLINGFYRADIIRGQHVENDASVITVGPNFYRLGGQDKERVIASIDDVYGITAQGNAGTILLRDWSTRRDVGFFTRTGLIIQ